MKEKKVIPVKMIRFPRYNDSSIEKKEKILWAINFPGLGRIGKGWSFDNYISNQVHFVDSLDSEIRDKLVIRLDDRNIYNIKLAERIQLKYKNVRIESRHKKTFSESARESWFVICDYHGSPDLESLLLGVPIVVFNADRQVLKNENYVYALDLLKKANVYEESPEKTAELINAHKGSIDAWLNDPGTQRVYCEYLKMFTGINHALDENTKQEIYNAWYKEFVRTE